MGTADFDTKEALDRAKKRVEKLSETLGRTPTACVVTFGCQMNARDSEKLEGILENVGFTITEEEESDFLIFNTCTVRENADNRLFGRLGRISSVKRSHPWMKLAICGCMMQETVNVDRIKKSYPFVDLIFGTHNIFTFPALLDAVYADENSGNMLIDIWDGTDRIVEDLPIRRKYAFKSGVNIMFGCNNFCSYCIVPYVRGRERSRRPQEILDEVKRLADDGVCEVMLLGQNVNSYGRGLDCGIAFPELLEKVSEIDGIRRVRFMTSHPKDMSDDLIDVIAGRENISRHIHLPLQSGSDRILKRMNRGYDRERYLDLAARIKDKVEGAALTTDIIIGFPGETPSDVDLTIDIVKQVRFQNAFTFIYSKRTGTPAATFEDQVDPAVVKEGFDRLLKTVQETAAEETSRLAGTVGEALVEAVNADDPTLVTGRLSNNMLVHFPGDASMIGSFVQVRLEEPHGFYYVGKRVEKT